MSMLRDSTARRHQATPLCKAHPGPEQPAVQAANGLGQEDTAFIIEGMAQTGAEPTYCMGDDIPLPVLSSKPHPLYNYFKQRFAQARPLPCPFCRLCKLAAYAQPASCRVGLYWASLRSRLHASLVSGLIECMQLIAAQASCSAVGLSDRLILSGPLCSLLGVQVTNPPIDPLREGLVMSLQMRLGKRGNLLQPHADAYKQVICLAP